MCRAKRVLASSGISALLVRRHVLIVKGLTWLIDYLTQGLIGI